MGTPDYISGATVGRWGTVPAGNTLADLNPGNNPALNPDYPSSPPWGISQTAVIAAWCGMGTDPVGRMWCWGGGHADYGGNEPYMLDLRAATPSWTMMRPPSGSLLSPASGVAIDASAPGIAASATGLFSDGRPRPTHTYSGLIYVPGIGLVVPNFYHCWPHVNGPSKAYRFNESVSDWALLADYTAVSDPANYLATTCYDASRNCLWMLGGGAYAMLKVDLATGVATKHGSVDNHSGGPLGMWHDAANDLIYIVSTKGGGMVDAASGMSMFDCAASAWHVLPDATGSFPSGYTHNGHGATYDPTGNRWLLWNGTQTNRAEIATLTRPGSGNLRTTAWTRGTLTLDGGNAVTPSAATTNGVYNRFAFIDALGIAVLINATNQAVYFFKVRA